MATVNPVEPEPPPTNLYSDMLKLNVRRSERLKRNVLETGLESSDNMKLNEEEVSKLLSKLGVDIMRHLAGYQICPSSSKKILMWFKDDIDISKFCGEECYKINDSVRTSIIRPMDKKEVTVSIRGLNFNTPDSLVMDYLKKHGDVVSDEDSIIVK